jgi:hypothetical protein
VCGELTGGLGRELEAPAEEIDGEGRSSGGLFVAAMLRGRVGAEERCEVLGSSGSPFIGRRGREWRGGRGGGGEVGGAAINGVRVWAAVSEGEGEGPGQWSGAAAVP